MSQVKIESPRMKRAHLNFLHLPGEIRNEIYTQLLVLPRESNILPFYDCNLYDIYPEILSVCRKTHTEALPILYGLNTFIANTTPTSCFPRLTPFHAPVQSSAMVALIRRYYVRIRLDYQPSFSFERARDAFTGMEELTVDVFRMNFDRWSPGVLTRFEGVRGVKNVRIVGSTYGFPRYVEWLEGCIASAEGVDVEGFEGEEQTVVENVRRCDGRTVGRELGMNIAEV
ncbi:hypothetical protein GLAREA_06630 [Glarea lozoyensis ATCC 20868]|uniref:F-box domain-containing protein n=1 Tax=Glarea lozoyensis (strain ATCC 20868 / MF5171) TaxID=1116229 RepID=S3D574_GLAL2|nr:uncharacterized protein GLAREA_06630 [Glarea lozoyensis ATCC 20868]EPE33617.1 hypothetical protein GLAREA_06630 [Glarea lozoyensis ATCC 20868]